MRNLLVDAAVRLAYDKGVNMATKPDILPKSGAGAWGTDELANTYKRDTPGQVSTETKYSLKTIKTLKNFIKKK